MPMQKITKVAPVSLAKTYAIISAGWGLIIGLIFTVLLAVGGTLATLLLLPLIPFVFIGGIIGGLILTLVLAIGGFVLGFICGYVCALLYNFSVSAVGGGIEAEFK